MYSIAKALCGLSVGVTLGYLSVCAVLPAPGVLGREPLCTDGWPHGTIPRGDRSTLRVWFQAHDANTTAFHYDATISPFGHVSISPSKAGRVYAPVQYSTGPERMTLLLEELHAAGMFDHAVEAPGPETLWGSPLQLRSGDLVCIEFHDAQTGRTYGIRCNDSDAMTRFIGIIERDGEIRNRLPHAVVSVSPMDCPVG